MNYRLFLVLFLEPLQRLPCLVAVKLYAFKFGFEVCACRAQIFYLTFKLCRLVKRK